MANETPQQKAEREARERAEQEARERAEKERAAQEQAARRAQNAPRAGDENPEGGGEIIWVISNRKDDRVVLHERDPRHPGGEAFIGGSAPDKVFRTGEIERLLHTNEIIEIPEPPEGKKKPVEVELYQPQAAPAQPGQAIQLGRKLDPEVVPESAQAAIARQQRGAPKTIASKATVPPPPKSERDTSSS
jgi:hypothetical protein